jgi:hypothetical protein
VTGGTNTSRGLTGAEATKVRRASRVNTNVMKEEVIISDLVNGRGEG